MYLPETILKPYFFPLHIAGESRWLINSVFFQRVHTNAVEEEDNYEKSTAHQCVGMNILKVFKLATLFLMSKIITKEVPPTPSLRKRASFITNAQNSIHSISPS